MRDFPARPRAPPNAAFPRLPCMQSAGFIRVSNGRFVGDDCQEFHFHGWNGWSLLKRATNDPGFITAKFKAAQAANLNGECRESARHMLMRFFLADDDTGPVLQTAPGMFDESVALTLDWLFAEAANYGIKLTPVFMNTWKKANGIPQFEQWCGTASSNAQPRPDIDPRSSLDINNRLQTPYDWLIWNLLNEPRCKYCGTEAVDSWYGEMAAHLKARPQP
ncbi:hypothetical protein D9Q98_003591 [Chlorella vulgaris]|uniref:Glycoside hydrolase family 5 domain-containing protein n=1 Tax=Chlorella vulgaris TaxID=3077 RepID=A0A9D4YZ66_CHLVU|nr:hypothetical protein D9Q98_003591 [Chlorella vulgaris]